MAIANLSDASVERTDSGLEFNGVNFSAASRGPETDDVIFNELGSY